MLWRIGGGVSRRLSIPRDTLVNIPGHGEEKINAAWALRRPALAIKVIKRFTGLKINHMIVIDLANFPKFIDDIGGVNVKTGADLLADQRWRCQRRLHAEPQPGDSPPDRPAGDGARPHPREHAATPPATT